MLKSRCREAELMDDPKLAVDDHRDALAGLRRIEWISGTSGRLWQAVRPLAERRDSQPLRILDVASGGGDVAIAIARRAAHAGYRIHVDGCDISPVAVAHARGRAAAAGVARVGFFRHDVLAGPLPHGYDVVMCGLFLHHLDEAQAVTLLQEMAAAARRLVLVDDLRRTPLGYFLAWIGCRLLSRSAIVHNDGPASAAAAFRLDEIERMLCESGLDTASVRRHWPQRFLMHWEK